MAFNGKKTKNFKSKKQSKTERLTRLAYEMGQVQRGLKNPESKITSSYKAGENSVKKTKQPLF